LSLVVLRFANTFLLVCRVQLSFSSHPRIAPLQLTDSGFGSLRLLAAASDAAIELLRGRLRAMDGDEVLGRGHADATVLPDAVAAARDEVRKLDADIAAAAAESAEEDARRKRKAAEEETVRRLGEGAALEQRVRDAWPKEKLLQHLCTQLSAVEQAARLDAVKVRRPAFCFVESSMCVTPSASQVAYARAFLDLLC
jgi:hypothetical protein